MPFYSLMKLFWHETKYNTFRVWVDRGVDVHSRGSRTIPVLGMESRIREILHRPLLPFCPPNLNSSSRLPTLARSWHDRSGWQECTWAIEHYSKKEATIETRRHSLVKAMIPSMSSKKILNITPYYNGVVQDTIRHINTYKFRAGSIVVFLVNNLHRFSVSTCTQIAHIPDEFPCCNTLCPKVRVKIKPHRFSVIYGWIIKSV